MKTVRSAIFWVHLAVGAAAGLVVLIMSVTGVALTYEKQMLEWADRRAATLARGTRPEAPGAAMPPETLFAIAANVVPGKAPTGVTLRADAAAPATVTLEGNLALLVDPYTGAIIGEPPAALRSFFRTMTVWHRYLALEGTSRATGKMMTGAANLGFLFLVVSGLYLWFPRVWTWMQFKNVLWFRRGLAPKARHFNWHNAIGFWSAVPLAIVVAGALPISYPWAGNLVYRLAGDTPPPAAPAPARPAQQQALAYYAHGVDASWAAALAAVPEWRTITTRLATSDKAPIVVTVDDRVRGSTAEAADPDVRSRHRGAYER